MRKPIFIAYSDIHHNDWPQYNEDDRRIKTSLDAEYQITRKARRLKVPALFVGDLLHNEKHITNKLFSYILPHYGKINEMGIHWFGISGNHDQSGINIKENQSFSYVKTISQTFNSFHCIDFESVGFDISNTVIHGIPYLTHDQGLLEELKKVLKIKEKNYRHILLLHTTLPETIDTNGRIIQTNTVGYEIMELLKKFDLVLVGHIHKPMMLSKKIVQVGATNQQRKTDKDCDLGYWIIYDDMTVKFKKLNTPKFIELERNKPLPKDKDNYYYHKLASIKKLDVVENTESFSDVKDVTSIAKGYIKENKVKNKIKKDKLIEILKDNVE